MASPFKSISCAIRYDNARIISWTMIPGLKCPDKYTLQIENSRAGGPWTVLSDKLDGVCAFVDSRKRNYNKRMDECYRLRLLIPDTGEEYVSDIVDAGNNKAYPYSADAENVIKQAESQIKESGCAGKLLIKRVWGRRCPLCTDFRGQSTVNEHCPRCLGTGIDGGYYPGMPLTVIKDSIQTQSTTSEMGYVQSEAVQCRCIAYPWIKPGDVWCEDATNKRFVINACTPAASYKTTTLIYQMAMNRVEYTDVLHSMEADKKVAAVGSWEDAQASTMPPHAGWDDVLSRP